MRFLRSQFERLVTAAIADIPEKFQQRLRNIAILIEDEPAPERFRILMPCAKSAGNRRVERDTDGEPLSPDRIIVFQRPLEEDFPTEAELRREIALTIRHEIAHHFGIEDERLEELGRY